ncbi:TonB-dependent receptor, partial [Bacteroides salyersiae]|uniref:TonB-dependent receptor n=1 Tax=Bacteroides salyersiae TaxID=291644 RepID=UPI001F02206A
MNYDYAGKYLIEGSFRYDGSSAFAKGHRWGFFPSVSIGWRISEESFIKNVDALSFVDNIKIRASYG